MNKKQLKEALDLCSGLLKEAEYQATAPRNRLDQTTESDFADLLMIAYGWNRGTALDAAAVMQRLRKMPVK